MQLNKNKISLLVKTAVAILAILFAVFGAGQYKFQSDRLAYLGNSLLTIHDMERELMQKDSVIKREKNEHEQKITMIMRQYSAQTLMLTEKNKEIDQLKKKLADSDIKISDLNSYIQVAVTKKDTVYRPVFLDHIGVYSFRDTSDALKINATFYLDSMIVEYDYKYVAEYDIITHYNKPKKPFHKRELYATVISNDPKAEISAKAMQIKQKHPTFHIGVGLGVSTTPQNRFSPSISISIYKPFIDIYL